VSLFEILLLGAALILVAAVGVSAWLMLGDLATALFSALSRVTPQRWPRQRVRDVWANVVLSDDVTEELRVLESILRDPRAYQRRWGRVPPRGLLLYGPPGTGKTLIARILAQGVGYRFLNVSTADVKDKFLGESERRMRELYRRAREVAPCIVFLDEIEALGAGRSRAADDPGGAGRAQNSLTSQLLQELDGFGRTSKLVFTVGATNHLELVDEALRSRLSYQVYIPLPDSAARERLFRLYTRPYAARLDMPLPALADASDGMSGRDIETVCAVAPMLAHASGKRAVGFEEWRRAFVRMGRALDPALCPVCSSQDAECPVCAGAVLGRARTQPK
jgi:SpoVK/Ycf46/Vps4 family AAA+-type ATPase